MSTATPSSPQIADENAALKVRVHELEEAAKVVDHLKWLMESDAEFEFGVAKDAGYTGQNYSDLVQLNSNRTIAGSVDADLLKQIAGDYLDLLGSSGAIYETNGDYALGIFSSGWCRMMDQASRDGCHTKDDAKALAGGQWHCHESCWGCSKQSIDTRQPTDVPCQGGIRLYAVPVIAAGKVVGSINFGYGQPPTDENQLRELSQKYGVDIETLRTKAKAHRARPPFIVELAKRRLQTAAKLIGEIVARKQAEEKLKELTNLEALAKANAGREKRIIELKRQVNELSKELGRQPPWDLAFADK